MQIISVCRFRTHEIVVRIHACDEFFHRARHPTRETQQTIEPQVRISATFPIVQRRGRNADRPRERRCILMPMGEPQALDVLPQC